MEQQVGAGFSEWAAGKPLGLSANCVAAVGSVDALRELMECRRCNRGPFALEPAIDERQWLSFYRRDSLVRGIAETLLPDEPELLYRAYRALLNPSEASLENRLAVYGLAMAVFMPTGKDLAADCLASLTDEEEATDEEIAELIEKPAMQFLIRVALPCWFVYGVLPHRLMWDVGSDDNETAESAIRRLVRLDPRVTQHACIRGWLHRDTRLTSFRADKLRLWKHSKTAFDKPKSESHWLKVVLGYLSCLSELTDSRLETPELRKLAESLEGELPADLLEYLEDRCMDDLSREIRRKRSL